MNKKKTRIALIDPIFPGGTYYSPTGLCYLSSYLKKFIGDKIDIRIFRLAEGEIDRLHAFDPYIVGFTSFTHKFTLVGRMVRAVRASLPNAKLIIGGPHISMANWSMPETFDYGVDGEGERTFLKLTEFLIADGEGEKPYGILYRDEGRLVSAPPEPMIEPIDAIPFPDRGSVENIEAAITADYFRLFNRTGLRAMQVTTSRGCPYKCKFCQPAVMWGGFRMHSAEYIAAEIELIHKKFGITAILIEDDLFTGSKKRVVDIIEILGKKGLLNKIAYYIAARAMHINDDWVDLFKTLGVAKVELGIESGSDEIARYLKGAKSSVKIGKNAIDKLNRAGIGVYASFIAGSPPEKMEDLRQTWKLIKWIKKNHRHNTCGICLATPLPGTQFWDYAVEAKKINPERVDWDKLTTLEKLPANEGQMIALNDNIPTKKLLRFIKIKNFLLLLGTPKHFIRAAPRRIGKRMKRLFEMVFGSNITPKNS